MERGDIAAVAIALVLVVILSLIIQPPREGTGVPRPVTPSPAQAPLVVTTPSLPPESVTPPETTSSPIPTTPTITARRIRYTEDYRLYPIRYLPRDMPMFGFSDVEWQYKSSVVFARLEEDHGGITEIFTVPYSVFRMNCTVLAARTPEKASLRLLLVDAGTGLILEGIEIRYPGSVTRTVVAPQKPIYMVIGTESVDRIVITLEAPASLIG